MSPDKFLVAIFSIAGMVFTFWFFLAKKEEAVEAKEAIDIVVEGGYKPSVISVPKGKTTTLNFIRKDDNSCLEDVVVPDFKIKKYLPLNKKVSIEIKPEKAGKFEFVCGMNMFHGKIIVR